MMMPNALRIKQFRKRKRSAAERAIRQVIIYKLRNEKENNYKSTVKVIWIISNHI